MRMSINAWDDGYKNLDLNARVFLDGVEQKLCVTADEEKGYVLRYKSIDHILKVDKQLGAIEQEEVYGKVEIIINY